MRKPSIDSILYFIATFMWVVSGIILKGIIYYALAIMCLGLAIKLYDKK